VESLKGSAVVFASATILTVVLVGLAVLYPSNSPTYTINGLTCPIPNDYLSFTAVDRLLPLVTTNSQFLILTNGSPFVFGNAENITNRTQQIGNHSPVHLPDVVEMVFYGPYTQCETWGQDVIVVQVPIQEGGFNITGATYHTSPR
jgi:hypothetical protein